MSYYNEARRSGIYYIPSPLPPQEGVYVPPPRPEYLPLLSLHSSITLYPTYSSTTLTQKFRNPSMNSKIPEAAYVFPLHPTQTITSFTAYVGEDKVIKGVVKSNPAAKKTYDEAVSRGETAGLLSYAAADVWKTTIGNIPEKCTVKVVIECVQELSHDMEKDATRFALPTAIAPRYGSPPQEVYSSGNTQHSLRVGSSGWGWWSICRVVNGVDQWVDEKGGMEIEVKVKMDSPVQMVESPKHPASLKLGTNSEDGKGEFDATKALLTLSNQTAALDDDFVVLVKTARTGHPSAVIQRHHKMKDTAAMMVTLVPKFKLPSCKPEVVFVADRSGSMGGSIGTLKSALKVFLKSLPVGCKFNICSFGSHYSMLWEKSQTYSESTLHEAERHVDTFASNMGGTEMFDPIKAVIENRYKDLNLEVLVLTDGEIWNTEILFDHLNKETKDGKVRVFSLGIGNSVSHALVEGLAKCGGGFSQIVGLQEKLEGKVVRMLRGALSQHVSEYKLDLVYPDGEKSDDDFEMVSDSETIEGEETEKKVEKPKAKISLFDENADLDEPMKGVEHQTDEERWSNLPPLAPLPEKLQSPHIIPPLYAFSRTNVYVVLSRLNKALPTKAILHAKTESGDDLELEIPIMKLDRGREVCQMAARSFISELEKNKGYLHEGILSGFSKDAMESKWDDVIEREGVRWGETFGIAGKWTSFVAVEEKGGDDDSESAKKEYASAQAVDKDANGLSGHAGARRPRRSARSSGSKTTSTDPLLEKLRAGGPPSPRERPAPVNLRVKSKTSTAQTIPPTTTTSTTTSSGSGLPDVKPVSASAKRWAPRCVAPKAVSLTDDGEGGGGKISGDSSSGSSAAAPQARAYAAQASAMPAMNMQAVNMQAAPMPARGGFGGGVVRMATAALARPPPAPSAASSAGFMNINRKSAPVSGGMGANLDRAAPASSSRFLRAEADSDDEEAEDTTIAPVNALINKQSFSGEFKNLSDVCRVFARAMNKQEDIEGKVKGLVSGDVTEEVLATILAVVCFEVVLKDESEVWELVVEKSNGWLDDNYGGDKEVLEGKVKAALGL